MGRGGVGRSPLTSNKGFTALERREGDLAILIGAKHFLDRHVEHPHVVCLRCVRLTDCRRGLSANRGAEATALSLAPTRLSSLPLTLINSGFLGRCCGGKCLRGNAHTTLPRPGNVALGRKESFFTVFYSPPYYFQNWPRLAVGVHQCFPITLISRDSAETVGRGSRLCLRN